MKLVVLTTPTCVKCKSLKPIVEKLCSERNIDYSFLDAIKEEELRNKYNVMSVPFLIFYDDNGEVYHTSNKISSEREIINILDNNL